MALVYDPRTGRLVEDGTGVPGNPVRAAAMQAQMNQPVTGPRGVMTQPATVPEIPEFPIPTTMGPTTSPTPARRGPNPNAIDVGGAALDTVLGGLSVLPAAALDVARTGATQLLGGDTSTLSGGAYARTNAALNRMSGGLGALGEANSQFLDQVQSGLLGVVGAQRPAAQAVAPVAATPRAAPAPVVPTPETPPAAPALLDVSTINSQIAQSLAGLRPEAGVTQPEQRGVYNAQNTNLATLQARANNSNGINFGFGVNGAETARQYLDRMQSVDQERALQRQQRGLMNEARWARQAMSGNATVGEIAAARSQLAALNPQINNLMQGQAGLAQTALGNQGNLAAAELQAAGALERTALAGEYALQQADLAGQYGLDAADLRAQGALAEQLASANSPESQASLAQAQLRQLQLALATQALGMGDPDRAAALVTGKGVPNARIAEDMLGNPIGTYDAAGNLIPYTEQQLAEYRRVSGLAQGR